MFGEDVEPATKFEPDEAPEGTRADYVESIKDLYSRLDLWNRGEWNGKWHNEKLADRRDRQSVLDALAGQLELTDYQRARARRFYQRAPDGAKTGYSVPLLMFCVAVLAVREDGRYYHPQSDERRNDAKFEEVRQDLGLSRKLVSRCYGKVKASLESEMEISFK